MKTQNLEGVSFFDYPATTPDAWRTQMEETVKFLENFSTENSLHPLLNVLEYRHRKVSRALGPFFVQHEAHHTEWSTALVEEFLPVFTALDTKFYQNEEVFQKLQDLPDKDLSATQQKLKSDYLKKFKEAGCGLTEEDRKRLLEINTNLAERGTQFQNALLSANARTLSFSLDELSGINPSVLEELEENGRVTLSLSRTNLDMVLEDCINAATRKAMHQAFSEKNITDDFPTENILQEMLSLRKEKAHILGYQDFAHLALSDKMAENPKNVLTLLEKVWIEALPRAEAVYNKAKALAEEEGVSFKASDVPFYIKRSSAQKEKEKEHKQENASSDFPLNFAQTLQAALHSAEKLFGLSFRPVVAPSYHPSCEAFVVMRDNKPVGGFIADYQKRSSKSPGAWMNSVFEQSFLFNDLPVVVNVGSFYDGKNKNAPLSFDDAVTIFHELGHAMHGLLSQTEYPSQSGTGVVRDFVELPSQLMENWVATHEGLVQCGVSPETAQEILSQKPDDSWSTSRYLASAFFDHALHADLISVEGPVQEWRTQIATRFGIPGWLPPHHEMERFSHIWGGGYECGYYSYLWAEALEADIFSKFKDNLFGSPELAHKLYSSGGQQKESALFEDIMGRRPEPSALFQKKGWAEERSLSQGVKL